MIGRETTVREARAAWAAFSAEAPELAGWVRARFAANLHHIIGTVRQSGAPRLSGSEVHITAAGVRVGMMAESQKLADVRRDPRVEIHSAPLEEDLAVGDAKLIGRLVEIDTDEPQPGGAASFVLLAERVTLVRVDGDELVVLTWDPARGAREQRRR